MIKPKHYWEVVGCSWAGRTTKREGKRITCGHKHKSYETAKPCVAKMRKARPGNCQTYQAIEIVFFAVTRRPKPMGVIVKGVVEL